MTEIAPTIHSIAERMNESADIQTTLTGIMAEIHEQVESQVPTEKINEEIDSEIYFLQHLVKELGLEETEEMTKLRTMPNDNKAYYDYMDLIEVTYKCKDALVGTKINTAIILLNAIDKLKAEKRHDYLEELYQALENSNNAASSYPEFKELATILRELRNAHK